MTDFAAARLNMVVSQVRTSDVTDPRIQRAMSEIPRELFVPETFRAVAYASEALPVGAGRALMEPRSLAKLLQASDVTDSDVVLVIGAGTGYGTAVLARLAEAVVALEEDQTLAAQASGNLSKLGVDNAAVVTGRLDQGRPDQGPFDVIFIDGGVEFVPKALFEQLKEGGRLAAIVLERMVGKGRIFTRLGDNVSARTVFDGGAPLLPAFARVREFSL
jgi:protein-L-isoaspartate(D-aspartate) O-methyltransferase